MVRSKGGAWEGPEGSLGRMHVRPRSSNGAQVRAQGGKAAERRAGRESQQEATASGCTGLLGIPRTRTLLSERAGCC